MDTSDRHDSMLPVRPGPPTPLAPSRGTAGGGVARYAAPTADAATIQVDPVGILRGLLRNWWKIVGLWLLVSTPVVYLIHSQMKPKYTASSRLMVQPTQPELFGGMAVGQASERTIAIETEIGRMRTNQVLDKALGDVTIANLPFVKDSTSPVTDLQEKLLIVNTKNTNYVTVSLERHDPVEAAAIVNAVVAAYLDAYSDYKSGADEVLRRSYQTWLTKKRAEREAKQTELRALVDGGVDNKSLIPRAVAPDGSGDETPAATVQDVSLDQLRKLKSELLDVQVELLAAKSHLQSRTQDFQDVADMAPAAIDGPALPEEEVARRVEAEFRSDPMIADLYARKAEIKRRLEHIEQGSRRRNDPARIAHESQFKELTAEIETNWRDRYHELRALVLAAGDAPIAEIAATDAPRRLTVQELRDQVEDLERRQASLQSLLAGVEVESKQSNSDTYRAQFLQTDIQGIVDEEKIVSRRLQDLTFRTNRDLVRVELIDPAPVPKLPSDKNKRLKLMAAAPVAVLGLFIGLFALLEIKAERVGDPDALSSRVQSEVYSLPPIPMARAPRQLGAAGEDDQIDRFIQRLDHLRFAVCGDTPDAGPGRCVLISSAVSGEGKTTLAAQLAARCGHAGHATLLIDADLRRGALTPLLDVPEGPGLGDVLTTDGLNAEDLTIPVQGGTFHLLGAGTPIADAGRVFQGRAFGMLIARLRQLYDLIIIDSPPILPVPDSLIMGRWSDGVVLTARFDVSRAPQVERARRQLDLAGIPVLGTVINGMRTADSYYGHYNFSRQPTGRESPADAAPTG